MIIFVELPTKTGYCLIAMGQIIAVCPLVTDNSCTFIQTGDGDGWDIYRSYQDVVEFLKTCGLNSEDKVANFFAMGSRIPGTW